MPQTAYAGYTQPTGGTSAALDSVDGAGLKENYIAFVYYQERLLLYRLDEDSGAAENSPLVVEPDTNAGNKRWILQGLVGALRDFDGDTYVNCEQSVDEDKVRIGTAGTQRGQFDSDGLTLAAGASVNEFSTDTNLAGNSDDAVPTEKVVKTFVESLGVVGANRYMAWANTAIMWFYSNTAQNGMTIDTDTTDVVLAVTDKVSGQYGTTGGAEVGTFDHLHLGSIHAHQWYKTNGATGSDQTGDVNGAATTLTTGTTKSGTNRDCIKIYDSDSDAVTPLGDNWSLDNTAENTSSTSNYRPAAAVGTFQKPTI